MHRCRGPAHQGVASQPMCPLRRQQQRPVEWQLQRPLVRQLRWPRGHGVARFNGPALSSSHQDRGADLASGSRMDHALAGQVRPAVALVEDHAELTDAPRASHGQNPAADPLGVEWPTHPTTVDVPGEDEVAVIERDRTTARSRTRQCISGEDVLAGCRLRRTRSRGPKRDGPLALRVQDGLATVGYHAGQARQSLGTSHPQATAID